jgi:signal transduction histidine kinase
MRLEGGDLRTDVVDRGMGIPAKDQPYMFDRLFRASNVTNIQGTGLGLNIVRHYLDLHGGTITFVSTEGEGTTFTFRIPQRP